MIRAEDIWRRFVARPGAAVDGNVGIASQHAIHGLLGAIRRYRPRRVLELGAGIGTLTYATLRCAEELGLLDEPDFRLDTVENNPFCLEQLGPNLEGYERRYQVLPEPKAAGGGGAYDLIIIDGGGDLPNDMGVMDFSGLLAEGGVILVEGMRLFQRDKIREWFGHRPFVYFKNQGLQRELVSPDNGLKAPNKPYHLYIFEPAATDRWQRRLVSFVNRNLIRVRNRVQR